MLHVEQAKHTWAPDCRKIVHALSQESPARQIIAESFHELFVLDLDSLYDPYHVKDKQVLWEELLRQILQSFHEPFDERHLRQMTIKTIALEIVLHLDDKPADSQSRKHPPARAHQPDTWWLGVGGRLWTMESMTSF